MHPIVCTHTPTIADSNAPEEASAHGSFENKKKKPALKLRFMLPRQGSRSSKVWVNICLVYVWWGESVGCLQDNKYKAK